jgi:hypothetical protein
MQSETLDRNGQNRGVWDACLQCVDGCIARSRIAEKQIWRQCTPEPACVIAGVYIRYAFLSRKSIVAANAFEDTGVR